MTKIKDSEIKRDVIAVTDLVKVINSIYDSLISENDNENEFEDIRVTSDGDFDTSGVFKSEKVFETSDKLFVKGQMRFGLH